MFYFIIYPLLHYLYINLPLVRFSFSPTLAASFTQPPITLLVTFRCFHSSYILGIISSSSCHTAVPLFLNPYSVFAFVTFFRSFTDILFLFHSQLIFFHLLIWQNITLSRQSISRFPFCFLIKIFFPVEKEQASFILHFLIWQV